MLTFAKVASELIGLTKLNNEDLVNILLGCVYEPLDLKDKNGNPYYAGKGACSYLLKGQRDVKLEIQRGTAKKEVISTVESYFKNRLIPWIIHSLLDDFLEHIRETITYDSSISESKKRELLLMANKQTMAAFLGELNLYVIGRYNRIQDKVICANNLPEQNKYFSGRVEIL